MSTGLRATQRERTRTSLLSAARRLFAERGYADVGLAELVSSAGVTKGALYHHFATKQDVFVAVLDAVQHEVAEHVEREASGHADAWDQLVAGCRAFLDASTAGSVVRVMLVDGPAVLGWAHWRAVDDATSARHLGQALDTLVRAGAVAGPVGPVVPVLSGALNEAALWVAGTTGATVDDVWPVVERVLAGLRSPAAVRRPRNRGR